MKSQKAKVEVVKPITLEESFDIVNNRLEKLGRDMISSDREVFHAIGEFAGSTTKIIQNIVDMSLTDEVPLFSESLNSATVSKDNLHKRFQQLRIEADQLLATAYTNEEIERALKLEQLLDRIVNRIKSLDNNQQLSDKINEIKPLDDSPQSNLQDLSLEKLKAMAKARNLKGYSKLPKASLIAKLHDVVFS